MPHPATTACAVYPSPQRSTFLRREPEGRIIRFESRDNTFVADISLDDDGVVLDYPGIARHVAQ